MNVLAIDTATETLGVCLKTADKILSISFRIGLTHSKNLLPIISRLYKYAGISPRDTKMVVCSVGPGSFTGIRIGLATAKGIAHGCGCQLIGVPYLDTAADRLSFFDGVVIPLVDAKKGRYYTAFYKKGKRFSDYLDISPDILIKKIDDLDRVLLTGPDAPNWEKRIKENALDTMVSIDYGFSSSDPYSLLLLGMKMAQTDEKDQYTHPIYLRKSEAEIKLGG